MKVALDNLTNQQAKLNYEQLCDLHVLLAVVCILLLLKLVHVLIDFKHK